MCSRILKLFGASARLLLIAENVAALPVNILATLNCQFMMNYCYIAAFTIILQASLITADDEQPVYHELYNSALTAYADEQWFACASHMERAIFEYHGHRVTLAHCLQSCQYETGEKIDATEYIDLAFFSTTVAKSTCIQRCKMDKAKALKLNVDKVVVKKEESERIRSQFEKLEPYNYLQICAYKSGDLETAASAAYTYLIAHPDDEDMQQNVIYYRSVPDFETTFFRDLENLPHQVAYREGLLAYADEDWLTSTQKLEKATRLYYKAYDRCAVMCEGHSGDTTGPTADFNMYIAGIKSGSKTQCLKQLRRQVLK